MNIESRTLDRNGVRVVEQLPPEGCIVIDTYHPCSSVTPWDYYGMCHQREYSRVLEKAGVEYVLLRTRMTILRPHGTGPGGSVRFGDNMMPGVYRIAVPDEQARAAYAAIAAHREELQRWLDDPTKPMPEACRG